MGLFYRLLGLVALIDDILGSIAFYQIIRLNWIVFTIVLLYAFVGASALGLPWPEPPVEIPLAYPGLQTALATSTLVLMVICWVRRDTIFRPMPIAAPMDIPPPSPASADPREIDLRITGRFDRGSRRTLSLHGYPVRWHIDDTGSILLDVSVEEVEGLPGFPESSYQVSSKLIFSREALIDDPEEGMLYFGLSARPAFRLRLPKRRETAILSVRNASHMLTLIGMLKAMVAESTAKEACFFRDKLDENPGQPSSTHHPEPAERQETPGEDIPWKNLIDFTG